VYNKQAENTVRVPIHRWRNARFIVPVQATRRLRSLAIPAVRTHKRVRGSFTETDARAP